MKHPVLQITALLLTLVNTFGSNVINDLNAARKFLKFYNKRYPKVLNNLTVTHWNFETNVTDHNKEVQVAEQLVHDKFLQDNAKKASRYNLTMMDDSMRRQFTKIKDIGTAAQTNKKKLKRLTEVVAEMKKISGAAKGCLTPQNCLPLEPDLERIMSTSRDYDQLLAAWKGWRDATGPNLKNLYKEYVKLNNQALQLLGYADTGAYWRSSYETPTFESDVKALFDQLKPLYVQLHAFARRRLKTLYGADKFPSTGHIPAHLLGEMSALDWSSLEKEFTPYTGKTLLNVTNAMVQQNYTAERIYRLADDFFVSLGMIRVPNAFWEKSMLTKPTDGRDVVCHASAWDFADGRDFRIKACTQITQLELDTAHHEMGHIQNFLQYKDLPVKFHNAANPGFHEAIGDIINLSVETAEHRKTIGLLETVVVDAETDINLLMSMALKSVAPLPFTFLVDQWRWKVFSGDIKPNAYNRRWWKLRCKFQGVSPPVPRSTSDFDPGAKLHIPFDVPIITYFVSLVVKYQFHKALCDKAGHTGPLHRCDIYGSRAAGTALSNMMKLGSSKTWPEALYLLTNQTKLSAQPLLDYFTPLLNYLKTQNGNDHGWQSECP